MLGLIGASGFVGQCVLRQLPTVTCLSREDLLTGVGTSLTTLYVAAPSAQKWLIDQDPDLDRENIQLLTRNIARLRFDELVLFSTVDVFSSPNGANEDSPRRTDCTYGGNRAHFEDLLFEQFDSVRIRRLPGLFGPGLKKNFLFDLLHNRRDQLAKYNPRSQYQYIGVDDAVRIAISSEHSDVAELNVVTPPLSLAEICGRSVIHLSDTQAIVTYDVKSYHALPSGYFLSRENVKNSIARFLERGATR